VFLRLTEYKFVCDAKRMGEYKQRALEDLAQVFGFSDDQLDLIGRCLALNDDLQWVRQVRIEYSNSYLHRTRCLLEGNREKRQICIDVALQHELDKESHETIMERIRRGMEQRGIKAAGLFAYCAKSYGLERDDINCALSFGFRYEGESPGSREKKEK